MNLLKTLFLFITFILIVGCSSNKLTFTNKVLYKTNSLIITEVAPNVYVHTSFLQTTNFGNVPCNGMIVCNKNEAIVFDTPINNQTSEELIQYINTKLKSKIKAVVPTHFHVDCLGGLNTFHNHKIASIAHIKTIALAKEQKATVPNKSFEIEEKISFGNDFVKLYFLGEGHTKDNIVAYYPAKKVLFGGCLIKELNAGKGNLADANEIKWSETATKVKKQFKNAKIVIPGHGKVGSTKLIDYTIKLFKTK